MIDRVLDRAATRDPKWPQKSRRLTKHRRRGNDMITIIVSTIKINGFAYK